MDPRLSDHLRERLSDDLPSIRLDEQGEGAHITGMILAIKMVDLGFGEHPVVTLLSAKGNAGEMHLMGTVLEDEWAAAQPKIGDYIGVKIMAAAMEEAKSVDPAKIIPLLESGMEFDILKPRKGHFRKWDHSLLQQMFVVKVKDKAEMQDEWDIFEIVEASPGDNEKLDVIQPTQSENMCVMG